MKIVGYIMIHYGSEYLADAIRSIDPFVSEINILYSEFPTHQPPILGMICPDSRKKLHDIVKATSEKCKWREVNLKKQIKEENQHLAKAFSYSKGVDLMLRLDSDEVWDQDSLQNCIDQAVNTDSRYIGVCAMTTLWRSFDHAVFDRWAPHRIHNMKSRKKKPINIDGTIYHFGYAINEATMVYKLSIHGHKHEFPTGWADRWLNWTPGTIGENWHPNTDAYWHSVEPFDKYTLPEFMHTHPYFNTPLIK